MLNNLRFDMRTRQANRSTDGQPPLTWTISPTLPSGETGRGLKSRRSSRQSSATPYRSASTTTAVLMQTPGVRVTNRSPRAGRKELHPSPVAVSIDLTAWPSDSAGAAAGAGGGGAGSSSSSTKNGQTPAEYRSTSTRPMKEAVIMGISFFFVYTSFQAIQNLQSSLHARDGMGVIALACVYGTGFCSSFITPAVIYHIGVKAAIVAAWGGHCLFVLCNMFPHWFTLLPGSLLTGLLSCPLWTSLEIYMTALTRQELAASDRNDISSSSSSSTSSTFTTGSISSKKKQHHHYQTKRARMTFHAAFSRLNGAFFSIFMCAQFSGNLISSSILFHSSYNQTSSASAYAAAIATANVSNTGDERLLHLDVDNDNNNQQQEGTAAWKQCGIHFCSTAERERKELAGPDPGVLHVLLAVYLAFELCGLAVTVLFLPDLHKPRWTGRDAWRKFTSHLQSLTQPRMWLLVPFLVSRMMNLAIEVGTFTQAYISCTLGIHMVGYVMATWGVATIASAGLLGWLARYTGRRVLCVSALTFDAVIFVSLTWWEPREEQRWVFFFLAILMGLVEGVWAVQVNALIASLFPSTADSAFAMKGMWSSLSMACTFLMATFLCPLARINIALLVIGVAFVSYVTLEVKHLR